MKAILKSLFLSSLLVLAVACDPAESDPFNGELEIVEGETLKLANNVEVTLSEVNDSRCPLTVNCIWEGRAGVEVNVAENGGNTIVRLNDVEEKMVTTDGYTIEFVQLTPFPGTPEDEADEPKVLKIKVSRGD